MSEPIQGLPTGWASVPIEELFQPQADGRKLHHGWSPQCDKEPAGNGEWGVLKTTAVQDGAFLPEHNKHLPTKLKPRAQFEVKQGDLLITCAGPRVRCGVPCLVRETRERLILSGKMYRFRVRPEVIDSRYMEAFLRAPETQRLIDKMKTGISDSGLNLTHGRFFTLQVPVAPRAEQLRIVAKIEELFSDLDAGVAALKRVQANLKRYRAAVLKAAVEGRLTEEWRKRNPDVEPASKLLERILAERRAKWEHDQLRKFKEAGKTPPKGWREKYEEPRRPRDVDTSSLPTTWCWTTIDQLITGDRSSAYGVLQPGDDVADGVPLVRVCDVADGRVAVDQLKRISPAIAAQFARTVLRGGEVLLTIVGTIGRTAVAPESLRGANTARAVAVLPISELVPVRFVELMLRDSTARAKLTLAAHEVARKTLNLEDVRIASIPVAPSGEQLEIVAEVDRRLSVADAAETQVEHALQRAARLRQAILKRAFEGRLVPQDPMDEPAKELLTRERSVSAIPTHRARSSGRKRVTA